MKKYKIYLFDFDGTLFDTRPGLYYVFKKSFGAVGVQVSQEDAIWLSRVPLSESYAKLNADPSKVEEFIKEIEDSLDSKESIETTLFYHDSDELFQYLKDNDITAGIVTSNNVRHVLKILDFFKMDHDLFKVYVGSNVVKEIKPNPKPIQKALELLNYKGDLHDVVYVGDSHNDCLCAKNAGVDYFMLDRGDGGDFNFPKIYSLMDLFK